MNSVATQSIELYQQQTVSHRWLIIVTIMLVAILEVLDSTIVNVALPTMMPTLGANQEEITWVLTSYIVASAMMLPLTGFLSNQIGHKRLLLINITGFMLSSVLCGLSNSLTIMVIFRALQGGFGAALIPLSQAILRQSFPLEEQGKAMAIWGIGIMVAPVLGPTLGGYITEYSNWRWVFYINVPFCFFALILTTFVIPKAHTSKQKIDWIGIVFMFIGIGCLQIFLDQGNTKDWLQSNFILLIAISSLIAMTTFIIRCLKQEQAVINLKIYQDRNFSISNILLAVFCGSLFATITLEPIMLESLFHYDTIAAGITLAPLGVTSALGMLISSSLLKQLNVKYILVTGLIFCGLGIHLLSSLSIQTSQFDFFIINGITGFGMGLFMVPLATYALATIDRANVTEAAGLFSYSRMLGTSIGISLVSTLVTRETQINWNQMGANISVLNNNLRIWLGHTHRSLNEPLTAPILGKQLLHQANMAAFIDAYFAISLALFSIIPFVFLTKSVKLKSKK